MADLFLLPFRPAFDPNGLVVPGAKLYFYKTQTYDPQLVYADEALTIALPNPVTANAAGVWPSIYLQEPPVFYRVILRDKADALLSEVDPYLIDNIDGLTETIQELTNESIAASASATTSADRAQGFATAIETVTGGYWYATLADGVADTPTGESFLIVTSDGRIQIGYNNGSGGVIRAEFLTNFQYSAADVLAKLLTVDGAGSNLDADRLDGFQADYFLPASSYTQADVFAKVLASDGAGSNLDADRLDGFQADTFERIVSENLAANNGYTVYGNGKKECWGSVSVPSGGTSVVTLPTPHTSWFVATLGGYIRNSSGANNNTGITGKTGVTSFTITNWENTPLTVDWTTKGV